MFGVGHQEALLALAVYGAMYILQILRIISLLTGLLILLSIPSIKEHFNTHAGTGLHYTWANHPLDTCS
jgi:hypothetical protein